MKKGTLVRLKAHYSSMISSRQSDQHGLGVVIEVTPLPKYVRGTQGDKRVLVSFPKLGVEHWRSSRLLKVVA